MFVLPETKEEAEPTPGGGVIREDPLATPISSAFNNIIQEQNKRVKYLEDDTEISQEQIDEMIRRTNEMVERKTKAESEKGMRALQRKMERNRERALKHAENRRRLREEAKAKITKEPINDTPAPETKLTAQKPYFAKRNTRKQILDAFHVAQGQRVQAGKVIEGYLDHVLEKGYLEDEDLRNLMDKLIEQGVVEIEADEIMAEGELLEGMAQELNGILRQFARDSKMEIRMHRYAKDAMDRSWEKNKAYTKRAVDRQRIYREADKAHYREHLQRMRNRRELTALQERTLKTLRWLKQNQHRVTEEMDGKFKAEYGRTVQDVLGSIDLFAIGAADELNWHPKYQMTWRDLADVYKKAKGSDNFLPSAELDRIVERLDGLLAKLGSKKSQEREFVRQSREIYRRALAESDRIRRNQELTKAARDAYIAGDDEAGDALTDDRYGDDADSLLEDDFDAYDPSHDDELDFSFGGENAAGADLEALERAKAMHKAGEPKGSIFPGDWLVCGCRREMAV